MSTGTILQRAAVKQQHRLVPEDGQPEMSIVERKWRCSRAPSVSSGLAQPGTPAKVRQVGPRSTLRIGSQGADPSIKLWQVDVVGRICLADGTEVSAITGIHGRVSRTSGGGGSQPSSSSGPTNGVWPARATLQAHQPPSATARRVGWFGLCQGPSLG